MRFHVLAAAALVLVTGALAQTADAADYERCAITYQFKKEATGEHGDSGPFNRTATACVRNQQDCHRRAEALARADAKSRETPPYDGGRTKLSTISVTHISMGASCDRLD